VKTTTITEKERPSRLVFAELKTEKGRIRPEQRVWLAALEGCSNAPETYLWRSGAWDEIQRALTT